MDQEHAVAHGSFSRVHGLTLEEYLLKECFSALYIETVRGATHIAQRLTRLHYDEDLAVREGVRLYCKKFRLYLDQRVIEKYIEATQIMLSLRVRRTLKLVA